ncbi:MAG: Rieske (2Fe-2S) protein [Verrucomicrobiia bacterium]|jgi:nitrite reductase/ring-hydroxylating ferredoxin subunit
MRTDENLHAASRCVCGNENGQCQRNHERRLAINRRRFLAVGSGCVLGALSAASGVTAGKLPPVDIGSLKKFSEDGISEEFTKDDFFVMRYQGRLFAASTTCPHMGGILQRDPQDSTRIKCGLHGSVFDAEGIATVGPASGGLTRLGVTVNKDGHVMVDPNKEFSQDKWTDKGCYVEVK